MMGSFVRTGLVGVGRRLVWPLLFTLVLAGVTMLGVFPTRSYFEKQRQVAASETALAQLTEQNAVAQRQVDALKSDEEIERLARENYGLVKPGEEAYHVLPDPQPPVQIPDVWPFNRLHPHLGP
jgi:cell division protein FtsB